MVPDNPTEKRTVSENPTEARMCPWCTTDAKNGGMIFGIEGEKGK